MPQDFYDYLLSIGVTFAAGAALSAIVFQAWGAHWKARAQKAEVVLGATLAALAEDPAAPVPQYWQEWTPEIVEELVRRKQAGDFQGFKSLEDLMAYCDER